ncbi:unnamed protein product [Phytophthora fragariaefolia]|uniref:Unnamed protein product n=1 Tax=Phytophthora fragariaefolia TaxID=1490495 RepID=A0A9W6TZR5_9STRA|nr:unnamed protein product [Phytophthora fragariaefolia]
MDYDTALSADDSVVAARSTHAAASSPEKGDEQLVAIQTTESPVADGGRNWTVAAARALAQSLRQVSMEGRGGQGASHVSQRIFTEYRRLVPTTTRKVKALDDKMATLNAAYKFISDLNAHRVIGSTGRGPWSSLDAGERKTRWYVQLSDAPVSSN